MIKIGQADVMDFMKENMGYVLSAEEIAKCLGLNKMKAYSLLKKLTDAKHIEFKVINPPKGPIKKLYFYKPKDELLEEIMHEYKYLKNKEEFSMWRTEHIISIITLREIKIMNRRIQNLQGGNKDGS